MPPSRDPGLRRFSRAERWTHLTIALLVLILIGSAACLYFPLISSVVGNRDFFKWVHVAAGFMLPIPVLVAVFFVAFRQDMGRINRWTPDDGKWLRKKYRRSGSLRVGKFNAGQKLHSAVQGGALIVLFGTGLIMYWAGVFTDDLRTGATFVHDWVAVGVAVLVAGHTFKALQDPTALVGMQTGYVPLEWAQVHHDSWAAEEDPQRVALLPTDTPAPETPADTSP